MKKLLIPILILLSLSGYSQLHYVPARDGIVVNTPQSPAQGFSIDARSLKRDSIFNTRRWFIDTAEVNRWFNVKKYREGMFPISVNTGGVLANGKITGGITNLWYYKNGVEDSNLVKMNLGLLDSSRQSTQFAIKGSETDSTIILQADSISKAGAYPVTDRKKVQRNEFSLSYAEMRTLTTPSAGAYYNIKTNNTFGQFFWDATSTETDDTVMVIKLASVTTGRLKRAVTDYIDLRWFPGVTEGGDIATPLQKAVTLIATNSAFPRKLKILGHYTCSRPIELWKYNSTSHAYEQLTINIEGDPGSIRAGAAPLSQITATFKDAPLFSMQLNKNSRIAGLFLTGSFTNPTLTDSAFYNISEPAYTDPTTVDKRFALYCAWAIDPLKYNAVPSDSGYIPFARAGYYTRATGQPTLNSGSTGCVFEDMYVSNFGAAAVQSINGATQNGEDMNYERIQVVNCKIAFVSTQSEEKSNNYRDIMIWSNVHTGFDNQSYGGHAQSAPVHIINVQFAGRNNQAFNWAFGGSFASTFDRIFGESLGKFGTLISGGVAGIYRDGIMSFSLPSDRGNYYANFHINSTKEIRFENSSFRLYNGQGWPIVLEGSPTFDHCTFDAPPYVKPLVNYSNNSYPQFSHITISSGVQNPGFGISGTTWGVFSQLSGAYNYGNYTMADHAPYASGYYKQYDINSGIFRWDKTIETGKTITVNASLRTFTFTTTLRAYFTPGEPLTLYNSGTGASAFAGLITDTTASTITVSYVPTGVASGTYDINVSKPLFVLGFLGNVTNASKVITKVINDDFVPRAGMMFYSSYFGGYNVIERVSNDTMWVAQAANTTATGVYIGQRETKKVFNIIGNTAASSLIPPAELFRIGDQIKDYSVQGHPKLFVCAKDGHYSTDSLRSAVFRIQDSTLAFDPPDGDSSKALVTTAWAKRNGGGGGIDTTATNIHSIGYLQTPGNIMLPNPNIVPFSPWPAETAYGDIYRKSNWNTYNDFTPTGSITPSVSNGKVIFSPNTVVWSNYLKILQTRPTMLNRLHMELEFKILFTPSSGTTGVSFGLRSANIAGQNNDFVCALGTTNAGGTLFIDKGDGSAVLNSGSSSQPALNDNIKFTIDYADSVVTFTSLNKTTSVSGSVSYTFPVGSTALPTNCYFIVGGLGNGQQYQINSILITSTVKRNANIVGIGASQMQGNTASSFNGRFMVQLGTTYPSTVIYAGGNMQVRDALLLKDEMLNLNGAQNLVLLGANDIRAGQTVTQVMDNTAILDKWLTGGSAPTYYMLIPEDSTAGGIGLKALDNAFRAVYGSRYIQGVWDTLSTSNKLKAIYNSGDGIHPNQAGNNAIVRALLAASVFRVIDISRRADYKKVDNNFKKQGDSSFTSTTDKAKNYINHYDSVGNSANGVLQDDGVNVGIADGDFVPVEGAKLSVKGGVATYGPLSGYFFPGRTSGLRDFSMYSDNNRLFAFAITGGYGNMFGIDSIGRIGLGPTTSSAAKAKLHFQQNTTGAVGSAPIKFADVSVGGTPAILTSPESYAFEGDSTYLYYTQGAASSPRRDTIATQRWVRSNGVTVSALTDSLNARFNQLDTTWHSVDFSSTTSTAFDADTITFTYGVNEVLRITAEVQAHKSTGESYMATKTMFYNNIGGTYTDGTGIIERSDQYIPTGGLTTYTFDIVRTAGSGLIRIHITPESATITGNATYQVKRFKL